MTDAEIELLELQLKRQELFIQYGKEADKKICVSLKQKLRMLQLEAGTAPAEMQELYDKVKELEKERRKKEGTEVYGYFITCNPDLSKDINYKDLMTCCHQVVKKKWINSYLWSIEQRGDCEAEIGKGIHIHMLIIGTEGKKYSEVVREIARNFKNMTDTSNYQWFSVKPVNEAEYIRKIRYIAGYKQDDNKIVKQRYDVIFRQQNNINKCYTSEDFDFRGQYEEVV